MKTELKVRFKLKNVGEVEIDCSTSYEVTVTPLQQIIEKAITKLIEQKGVKSESELEIH